MEQQTQSTFDEDFNLTEQKKFLSLLIYDPQWALLNGLEVIRPEYFDSNYLKNICKWIKQYAKKYKNIPTKLVLQQKAQTLINDNQLSTKEYYRYQEILDEIFTLEQSDELEYFKEKAIEFARTATWKAALFDATNTLKIHNYEEALAKFREVLDLGSEKDLGTDFKEQTPDEFLKLLNEKYDKANMIQTGIEGWDKALGGGFARNNIHIIAACPGGGKEVSINTPLLTPTGWKMAKEIKVNDYLIGRNGKPTKVLGVYPQGISQNYKITFNDHSITNCGINHLWGVYDTGSRDINKLRTVSLKEILEKGLFKKCSEKRKASGRKPQVRWKIPLVEPVQFDKKEYIISPYNMGALLGDGHFGKDSICLSCSEKSKPVIEKFITELPESLKVIQHKQPESACPQYKVQPKIRYSKHNLYKEEIKRLGLALTNSRTKFIPKEYLFGSVEQRIDLLRGLMDTDGTSDKSCRISYATISEQLAKDIVELVQSLGGLAHINLKSRKPRESHNFKDETYYNIIINININPFTIEYKSKNWYPTKYSRYIVNVEQQEDVESVCFKVDAEDELFVMENYIVTHNSRIMAFLTKQAVMAGKRVIFISCELDETETMANINSSITGLSMYDILKPENREEFIKRITNFKNTFGGNLKIKFYGPKTVNCDTIHNYIRKVMQEEKEKLNGIEWKPDFIVVDYMDNLLPIQKMKGSLYEDGGAVANDLKNLAISFDCPIVTGSQLGKFSWNIKEGDVISMDSIAESAAKVHLAHSMTTVNSNPGEKALGRARLFLAKSRSGSANSVVWVENDLPRCRLREIDEWNPKDVENEFGAFSVKSGNNNRK